MAENIETISKQVQILQETVDRFGAEALNDRKDISEMKISMATMTEQLKQVMELINKQQRTITNKVEDTMTKTVDSVSQTVTDNVQPMVQKTLDNFVEKKESKLQVKKKKRFWFF